MEQRAGWYDDPQDAALLRYFDGVVWSAHTTPKAPVPPAAATTPIPQGPPTQQLPTQAPTPGQPPTSGQPTFGEVRQDQPPQYGAPPQPPQYGAPPQQPQYGAPPQQPQYGQGQQPQYGQGQQPPYPQQQPQYGQGQQPPYPQQQPQYGQGQQPQYGSYPGYQSAPAPYPGYATLGVKTTPDGVPLASYGQRVGAFLLDRILLLLLVTVCSIPWIGQLVSWYTGLISDVVNDPNATIPTDTEIMQQITPYLIPITIVGIVVSLLYNTIFLTRVGATPGMLAVGLRVRGCATSPES